MAMDVEAVERHLTDLVSCRARAIFAQYADAVARIGLSHTARTCRPFLMAIPD